MPELLLPFPVQAILFSFLLATSTSADMNPFLFRWAFQDSVRVFCVTHSDLCCLQTLTRVEQTLSSQLATCSPNVINIIEVNATMPAMGVPPFYMISYAVGGTPVTSLLGPDENNLVFTVTQPPGMFSSRPTVAMDGKLITI